MRSGLRILAAAVVSVAAVLLSSVRAEGPIHTTVCELMRQPHQYDGKLVQVRGMVASGMETGGIIDSSCSAFLLVDNLDTILDELQGEIAYLRSADDLGQPTSLTWKPLERRHTIFCRVDQSYRTLLVYLRQKLRVGEDSQICFHCPLYQVTAMMTGRFDHLEGHMVATRLRPGAAIRTYSVGFGHLNAALSRMVLRSISDVVAKPIDPAAYGKMPFDFRLGGQSPPKDFGASRRWRMGNPPQVWQPAH